MSLPEIPTTVATTRWTPGGTPYSPVYGVEAYLLQETLLDSPRVQACDGTSQVIRPTYSCPCPMDLRQRCRCP
jgi:hypothetical protein